MTIKHFVTQEEVNTFLMLSPLLVASYYEFSELSKKKPESALNEFKIKAVNRIIVPLKEIMKNEDVYDYLDILDVDNVPTNSDVVFILGQYKKALEIYTHNNQTFNTGLHKTEWNFEPKPKPTPRTK